ncbi:alpha-2-macroglobulin [Comamonadaceae bacterium OH2545_COT-014]|nr:alpha-2-macroglobulin [Comamonadaceae bacterium OH2545_COT-014]
MHPLTLSPLRALLPRLSCAAWLLAASAAQALSVSSVSPQGEVAQVRQVVVKFSEAAVRFGDPQAPAPFALRCNDEAAARGTSRWTGEREWVHDFARTLPPGVRCELTPVPGFKSPAGAALKSAAGYTFQTGGPAVQRIRPHAESTVEEDQVFVLHLTGPATAASVKDKVWCSLPDVGERVPVRLLEGAPRAALLKALGHEQAAQAQPQQWLALQCQRRFTPGTQVRLVYGTGVATPSGLINRVEKRFAFTVREPFNAEMSCERENAQAACMPIRPVTLRFSAPVPRALAEGARLRLGEQEIRPQSVADGDEKLSADSLVEAVTFAAPLAENAAYTLTVPPDLQDASGRALANGPSFPLTVQTGPMPPLAKFAAAPFGIVERFADGPNGTPALPVTLRRVEAGLTAQAMQVSRLQATEDADIIAWLRRVERYDETLVPREQATKDAAGPLPPSTDKDDPEGHVQARALPLLAGRPNVQTLALPGAAKDDPRPFEVVGIPLTPGFHVLEIGSKALGRALLDDAHGADRTMYVRTAALVTNLGVHFKLGRENALAWVTTLDKGQPVPGARVRVSDCKGRLLAEAATDEQGIARFKGLSPEAPTCHDDGLYGDTSSSYFVSARATDHGVPDMAFTWSGWQRGIEPWRFNVPTESAPTPSLRVHTVFDRPLLRAGETVSMKHFARTETGPQGGGFALPAEDAATLVITHVGSGQEFTQPLAWRATPTGGKSAASQFAVPPAAKLGVYQVALKHGDEQIDSGRFRVEEFRLPVFQGSVGVAGQAPLVAPARVPVQVQLGYVSGGPAAGLPVRVSALLRGKHPHYAGHEDFSFAPPRSQADEDNAPATGADAHDSDDADAPPALPPRVVADKRPLTLDAHGNATLTLEQLPPARQPRELVLEASYADPNGEIQTLRGARTLWPAAVVAGIRAEGWVSAGRQLKLQALALDLDGQPKAGVPLTVRAVARITTSSRKRMVGGFYAYDSHTETKDLGTVCTGSSDARGLLACDARLSEPGEVELIASARDGNGRAVEAAQSVWVTRQGELWFGGDNHDRMDVLAEKKHYAPGETARFQVRMPFRQATALVAVEREGIVETQIVQLRGDNPTISLKVGEHWAPNVYVSVLALRGRLHHVPWYSFFTWGFKNPRQWWQAFWHDNPHHVPPTALVDLSKPAFRLGMAEIRVDSQAHRLQVAVKADQASYPVRGTARVSIEAKLPDGQPAAHAEVAVAAVDQALLELMPNRSWNLLDAMLQRRAWGVGTATAQMEIVGRRHYGRKAVPAGGDGGGAPTRELLDTLLLWNPRVALDAQGRAQIDVPLNDALTTFQIVAVADSGAALFGTGQTAVRTTQDLQIISGLPPLVRGGDRFRATLTLRNTTAQPMKVDVTPRATLLDVAAQTVDVPAGQAREVHWDVTAPPTLAALRPEEILWEIEARDQSSGARDALKLSQRVVAAVPTAVQQATLTQLDGLFTLGVAPPAGALPGRGGLHLALQPRLADGLPGVRDWFARYPYTCLEQKTSKAIGLRDEALWRQTAAQLPAYLDADGLASYFPPRAGSGARGSDSLSAWLLAATHEAARLNPAFTLPPEAQKQLITGLTRFVEGRLERRHWSPREDLDVRKLAAIEALARHGAARAPMLASLTVAPAQWPTSALLDWISILKRVPGIPEQRTRLQEAEQALRTRLSWQGTRLVFSTEQDDHWWWLMAGGDVNTARLLLTVLEEPAWQGELGRIVTGFIARQHGGAWGTTTANLWGSLALEQFSKRHEAAPVSGATQATLGGQRAEVDWAQVTRLKAGDAAPATRGSNASAWGAPPAAGQFINNTMLLPWPASAGPKDAKAGAKPNAPPGSEATLVVAHQGNGKPWLTVQSLAAVPRTAPLAAGYQIRKTVTPVEQAGKGQPAGRYARGDVLRVKLEVTASADMTWVAITDPVPGGATILGSGLERDSAIATEGERRSGHGWLAYEERSFEAFRSYYEYLPKGTTTVEYTVRLNNPGAFQLPPSRVEALYAPDMFGETPNAPIQVE